MMMMWDLFPAPHLTILQVESYLFNLNSNVEMTSLNKRAFPRWYRIR